LVKKKDQEASSIFSIVELKNYERENGVDEQEIPGNKQADIFVKNIDCFKKR
jgi:hypothetical protein